MDAFGICDVMMPAACEERTGGCQDRPRATRSVQKAALCLHMIFFGLLLTGAAASKNIILTSFDRAVKTRVLTDPPPIRTGSSGSCIQLLTRGIRDPDSGRRGEPAI